MLRIYVTPPPTITSEDGDISSPPSDGTTPGAPPPLAAAPPGQFFRELLDPRRFGQFAPPPSAPPGRFFQELLDPRRFGQGAPQPAPPGQFLASIGVKLPPAVPPAPQRPAPAPAAPAAPAPREGEGDGLARNAAAGLSEGVYGTLGLPVDAATWLVNRGIDGVNAVAGSEISNLGDLPLGSRSIATNLEHFAGIPDLAKVRAVTQAEKAARAAGEGAAYAIAPQVPSHSFGRNVASGLIRQTALGNADPPRVLGAEAVAQAAPEARGFIGERRSDPNARNNFQRQDITLAGDPNNNNDKDHDGIDDDLERLRSLALPTSPNAGALTGVPRSPFSPAAGLAGGARPRVGSDGGTGRAPAVAGPSTTSRPDAPRPAISADDASAREGVVQAPPRGQAAVNRGNVKALGIPDFLSPRQALHMPPVTDGRSVLTVDPQELLAGLHEGAFTILRQPKPGQVIVDFGRPIGESWDMTSGNATFVGETRFGLIYFGKKGAHIVPARPRQW